MPEVTDGGVFTWQLFSVSVAGVEVSSPDSGLPCPGRDSLDLPGLLVPFREGWLEVVIRDYDASMERLDRLPVNVVHGGHFPSFGRERFRAVLQEYREGQRKAGCHLAS